MVQTAERQKVQYLILPLLPYNPDVTSVPRARLGGLAAPFITQCPELKLALSIPCLLATLFFLCPFSFPLLARAGGSVDWWSGVLFATGLQLLYVPSKKCGVGNTKNGVSLGVYSVSANPETLASTDSRGAEAVILGDVGPVHACLSSRSGCALPRDVGTWAD